MKQQQQYALQVVIASGPESLSRAVLGFAFALSAAASGVKVMIILTMQGAAWAEKNIPAARQLVNGFAPIVDYLNMLEDNGVAVRLCSSCAEGKCMIDKLENKETRTVPYIGLTEAVIQATRGAAQTIVF